MRTLKCNRCYLVADFFYFTSVLSRSEKQHILPHCTWQKDHNIPCLLHEDNRPALIWICLSVNEERRTEPSEVIYWILFSPASLSGFILGHSGCRSGSSCLWSTQRIHRDRRQHCGKGEAAVTCCCFTTLLIFSWRVQVSVSGFSLSDQRFPELKIKE